MAVNIFHTTNLVSSVTVSPSDTHTQVSHNSQFKELSQSQNLGDSPDEILNHFKSKYVSRLANGHLTINSFRNKFDQTS